MVDNYKMLKSLIALGTSDRFEIIKGEIAKIKLEAKAYELKSARGTDRHLSVSFSYDTGKELWLTANYDTFEKYPSANNNASGVVTLLGLAHYLKENKLPIDARLVFFDAGLDPMLTAQGKRDPNFTPGSNLFLNYLVEHEIEFIEPYAGAIVIQAVGKGDLRIFEKTGKKEENSSTLNNKIIAYGKIKGVKVELEEQSPLADNISFLKQKLAATVLTRYHEGAWHKMQTPKDDLTNVHPQTLEETIEFIGGFLQNYND